MKRKPKTDSGFLMAVIINLIFDLEWTIPAWILLAAHFIFKISLWWFVGALGFWIVSAIVRTAVLTWLVKAGNTPDPPKENKNPYSSKKYQFKGDNSDAEN